MATVETTREAARERLLAGLPVEERRQELAGISTALLEGGEGPSLILLHGPGEFAAKWLRVIPELVRTHHVVAPDLPAHGASEIPDPEPDVNSLLDWLDALIELTCAERPALVGHVLGGAIAARFAIDRPERLRSLVLVDSLGLARFRPAPRFAVGLIGFQARPSERSYSRFMRQCSLDLDGLRGDLGELWDPFVSYNLDTARGPGAKAIGRMLRRVGLPRIPASELARISVPTSLIWGRQDRANRLRIAETASARFGWPLHVIESCADDPARDQPRAFVQALRGCLERSDRLSLG
jgi:pimeloyl-ACP methyl ester carboxylesterase